MNYANLLRILLRITGTIELSAFAAVVMPRDLMTHYKQALGLGDLPGVGIADFMIRQASYTYGMHGVVLWLLSFDLARYRPLLILTGVSYTLAGPAFMWIDISAEMPPVWSAADGAGCFLFGVAVLFLLSGTRRVPAASSSY